MKTSSARYELIYWPVSFRGCFISYPFAFRDAPLIETFDVKEVLRQQEKDPANQSVPFIGPPLLLDKQRGLSVSQTPAILLYVAPELDLMPSNRQQTAYALKVLMDCNDLLMEICRSNGSSMWTHSEWQEFRSRRLPRWLGVIEESMQRGLFGSSHPSFADTSVYALLGNMIRCLPELCEDVRTHSPLTSDFIAKIGSTPSLAAYVEEQEQRFGQIYCGGEIEQSIREMLAFDASN